MTKCTVLVLVLLPSLTVAQSLGDAARKEAERRKKNQASGTSTTVVGDEDLARARDERKRDAPPATGPATSGSTESTPAPRSTPARGASDTGGRERSTTESGASAKDDSPVTRELDQEERRRAAEEATWHKRIEDANARLERARRVYESIKGYTLVPGQQLVDSSGRAIARSPAELQRMVSEAQAERESAEKALEDLMEAARQAGIPPGWLR